MRFAACAWLPVLAIAVASSSAQADRPRPHGFHGRKFEANKTFGLGLELGDLVGLTGKVFVAPSQAIDFGIGDIYDNYYVDGGHGGVHVYADYLWHPVVLANTDAFELPLYIGVGGRFFNTNDCGNVGCTDVFGIRAPIGVTFDFNDVPLDVFAQVVPTLDFFHDYGPHGVYLDVDFTIGIRYWFI